MEFNLQVAFATFLHKYITGTVAGLVIVAILILYRVWLMQIYRHRAEFRHWELEQALKPRVNHNRYHWE